MIRETRIRRSGTGRNTLVIQTWLDSCKLSSLCNELKAQEAAQDVEPSARHAIIAATPLNDYAPSTS